MRVAVLGVAGRMGRVVAEGIAAEDDLELVCGVDPHHAGTTVAGVDVEASLDALVEHAAEVAVDFTRADAAVENATWCLQRGIHMVIGTTGIDAAGVERIRAAVGPANAVVAPNFAIGAVLMMHLARIAARYLPHVEIVELHHDGKADAPSGTALRTAELVAEAREQAPTVQLGEVVAGARGAEHRGIRVHAVRLPGLVAHQEVIFGAEGQTLTIRHDAIDRRCFLPGVLLAVRKVPTTPGLTIGLEPLLGL